MSMGKVEHRLIVGVVVPHLPIIDITNTAT